MGERGTTRLWYPHFVRDFRAKTRHLSLAEKGAYRELLDEYWERQGPLPADETKLRRIVGADPDEWTAVRENVLAFFEARDSLLHHKRVEEEIQNARDNQEEKARRMAKVRAARSSASPVADVVTEPVTEIVEVVSTGTPIPSPSPLPKNQEPRTNLAPAARKNQADEIRDILGSVLSPEIADAVMDHRRKLRKPLSLKAAELLAGKFARCRDGPEVAAETMIARGWQGFEPEWMERNGTGGGNHEADVERAIAAGFAAHSQRVASSGS